MLRPGTVAALLIIGCAPETDLHMVRARRERPDAPVLADGGVWLVDPPSGATVPPNLAAIAMRASRPEVEGATFRLHAASGANVPLGSPEPVDCAGTPHCYRLALTAALAPGTAYLVEPGPIGGLATAMAPDRQPPRVDDLRV